ncbi:MAG: hypothetical protein WAU57_18805, partial [Xanthobacteraceae bacterium]
ELLDLTFASRVCGWVGSECQIRSISMCSYELGRFRTPFVPVKAGTQAGFQEHLDFRLRGNERSMFRIAAV